jgi:glc operon protein GlcG
VNTHLETASISLEAAQHIVTAAIDEGSKRDVRVVVAVVDPTMNLVAFARADGSMPHSIETSRRKANTSASSRRASGWMNDDVALALPLATGNLITNVRGGFPLSFDGKHLGGVGIAGGTPDQDAEIGRAVLDALGFPAS